MDITSWILTYFIKNLQKNFMRLNPFFEYWS